MGGGSGWIRTEKCSVCENSKKKLGGGGRGRGGGGGSGWGGQSGCEWRSSEAFVKIKKKKFFFFFWGGGGGRVRSGGGVGLGEVRVDGNGELKLL